MMITDVDTCLKQIADWYVKSRREITEPELEAILAKHCEDDAEVRNFVSFLETEPGQLRFKTLLRERKGQPTIPKIRERKGQPTIPKTRVSSLGFQELELPVARAVEALIDEKPWSSGFHGALNQRWTIVFKGKVSNRVVKAAEAAGLEVAYREAPVGSGQILTDVSLPDVGVTEVEKATAVFNRFAELYDKALTGSNPSEFNPGEIVKYKDERVRVRKHIGDRVQILIPSRQEEVWVRADSLEKIEPETGSNPRAPIIHEAVTENPDPTKFMPIEVTSAFPEGTESVLTAGEKAKIDKFIEEVPDKNDPGVINYWVDMGDKKVYLEGWCDKCLAGTGYPPIGSFGDWDEKIQWMVRRTKEVLPRKAQERNLSFIEGGFREFEAGDRGWLYGVTWGVYGKLS